MTKNVINIANALNTAGFKCFIAGGFVRDKVMGRENHDIDLVTDATPDQIEAIFDRTIPIGKSFGVITVVTGGESFEVATLRVDSKAGDGRRPDSIEFTTDLAEDAKRRDFTINAMFMNPLTGDVIDFFGARTDIRERRLHAVGDPNERFKEDHLRMLRAVRFAITHDLVISNSTRDAIKDNAHFITGISAERIRTELMKILAHQRARVGVELLHELGLLQHILPEVVALRGVEQPVDFHPEGCVWAHTMLALDQTADATAIERLAVLLHDIGKPSTQAWSEEKGRFQFLRHESVGADMVKAVMRRLKFSRIEIDAVHFAVKNHMKMHQFSRMGEAKKIALMKHQFSDILKTVAIADSASTGDDTVALRAELDRLDQISVPEPLITGSDLLAFGIPEGKRIGRILRIVREKQIEGKINTVADALKTAKGIV